MAASCLLQRSSLALLPRLTCPCQPAWLRESSPRGCSLLCGLAGHARSNAPAPNATAQPAARVQQGTARAYGNDAGTAGADIEAKRRAAKRPTREAPRDLTTFGSVGHRLRAKVVHLVDEDGTDLGDVRRADTIRMMEERGLKLVALQENATPPVYRLMSGKQIYSEQLKLRQQQQDKPQSAQTQIKEISFSADIGSNDLEVKKRKIQEWVLEKQHHVRVNIKNQKKTSSSDKMIAMVESVLEPMAGSATFVLAPRAVNNGAAVTCILRRTSERERAEHRRKHGSDGAKASKSREKRQAHSSAEDATEAAHETLASVEEDLGPAAVAGIGSEDREQRNDGPQPAGQNVTHKPKEDETS